MFLCVRGIDIKVSGHDFVCWRINIKVSGHVFVC